MNLALELDPVSLIINSSLGMLYLNNRQPEKALLQAQKTIGMDPTFAHARTTLSLAHALLNDFPEAVAEGKIAVELSNRSAFSLSYLGWSYAGAGMEKEARIILDELIGREETRYVSSFWIALVYAGLREKDNVFERLSRAYEERYESLIFLDIIAVFDPIRDDPRFADLLEKVGLADFN
jgi:tetratricopeptide (TPR) repeat protein